MFIAIGIVIILIYASLVYYIGWSGWRWLKPKLMISWKFKLLYILTLTVVSTSFITGRIFDNVLLNVIGAYWMALFYLMVLLLPLVQICILLFRLTPLPRYRVVNEAGFLTLFLVFGLIAFGSYNAYSPVVNTYDIHIAKKGPTSGTLKIVMVADMHFGVLSGKAHADRMVKGINKLQPDLVLIPGDIFDDSIDPYIDQGMDKQLATIKARHGVYASLGNHDNYSGGLNELIGVLEKSNINVLLDETVTIAESITLVGHKDRSDRNRKGLEALMAGIDRTNPVILLEHQPYDLNLAAQLGVDLMVSGHTHRGQVAPFVTKLIYENDWGHLQKETFHSIVTSGYGFWGPPIRIGSRSEIVVINVTFGG